jgi:FkbM family methyltransferase
VRVRHWLLREIRWPSVARQDLWAVLGLFAVTLFFFRDAVLGRGVLFRRDISLVWYPQIESFVRCIAMGSWPLWDPYRGFGQPLLADPSAEVLYPFTWMNLVARPWVVYTSFVVAHLAFSGIGLYALARRFGVSRPGSFTAALAWIASGPFLSLASTWHHMAGAAWMPWVLLASEVAVDGRDLGRAVLWGCAVGAQILAGSADMVAMTLVAWAVYAAVHRIEWTRPLCAANRRLATVAALAAALGLALSAAQWLPTLEMARGTARLDLDAQERTIWSVHPLVMLEAILPFEWNRLPLTYRAATDLLEWREPWLHSIYLGVPLLALAVAGASGRGRRAALALLGCGATLVALGRHSPIYAAAVWLLPPLRILRFPMKAMVVAALAAALLAGMGFDEWRRDPDGRGRRWRWGVAAPVTLLALVAVSASALAGLALGSWAPPFLDEASRLPAHKVLLVPTVIRLLVAACAAGAVAILSSIRSLPGAVQAGAIGLLMSVDLCATHRNLHPVGPKAIVTHRPEVLASLDPGEQQRVYVYDYSTVPRSRRGQPGSTNRLRLESVPAGWTPLQALTVAALAYLTPPTAGRWGVFGSYDMDLLGLQPQPLADLNEFLRQQEGTPGHTRLLQIGSISNLVDLAPPSRWPDLPLVAVVPGLFAEPTRVYRVPDPLPRTYVVGRAVAADGQDALHTLTAPEFDPRREILLPHASQGEKSEGSPGRSRIVRWRPDCVVIEGDLSAPGYVVLVDAYGAGWRAFVDGRPAPLLRANVAFRAVEVPTGLHEVEFRYRPASVLLGLGISAAALAATLVLSLGGQRTRWAFRLLPALSVAYSVARRSRLLETAWFRRLYVRVYFSYKRRLEDPFAALVQKRPDLFRDGHIIDVGAHIGYTAVLFQTVLTPGYRVYAFEPEPANLRILEHTIRERGAEGAILPVAAAVGDRDGTTELWRNPRHPGDHRLATAAFRERAGAPITTVPVRLWSLDGFLSAAKDASPVAFVKVDAQGSEPAVCRGMEKLLARCPRAVVAVEYAPRELRAQGFAPDALVEFFRSRGYAVYSLSHDGRFEPAPAATLDGASRGRGYLDLLCAKRSLEG